MKTLVLLVGVSGAFVWLVYLYESHRLRCLPARNVILSQRWLPQSGASKAQREQMGRYERQAWQESHEPNMDFVG